MIMMSVKFQLVLPEDLACRLKRTASRLQIPVAEFMREAVREKLRASKPERSNFLTGITGIGDSVETDLSSRVDEILYGPDSDHG